MIRHSYYPASIVPLSKMPFACAASSRGGRAPAPSCHGLCPARAAAEGGRALCTPGELSITHKSVCQVAGLLPHVARPNALYGASFPTSEAKNRSFTDAFAKPSTEMWVMDSRQGRSPLGSPIRCIPMLSAWRTCLWVEISWQYPIQVISKLSVRHPALGIP